MGECKTCKLENKQLTQGVCDGCILQTFDQTGKKPLKATKGKDGYPAFGKAFRTGWAVVKGKKINCEDNSHEEGWSYCGKSGCKSCGGGA